MFLIMIIVVMLKSFSVSTMRLYRTSKDINEYSKTSYRAEPKGSSLGKVSFFFTVTLIH